MKKITNLAVKTGISATDDAKRLVVDALTEHVSRNGGGAVVAVNSERTSIGLGPGEFVIAQNHAVVYFSATGALASEGMDYAETAPDAESAGRSSAGEDAVLANKARIE